MDPEKITETPEKSIMTYLTFFYHLYRERDEAKGELSARAIRKSFSKESLSESSTKKDSLEFIPKKNVFGENRRSRRSTDLSFTTTTTIVNKKNALDSEEATKQVDEISKLRLDTETFLKEEEQKLKLDFEKKLEEEHRKLEEERKKLLEMKSELERQKNEIQPPEPVVTRPARSNTLMNEDRLREVLKKTIEEERMAVQLEKEKFLEEERKAVQQEKDKLKKQYEEEIEALKAAQMNFLETKITSLFSELTSKIQSRDEEIASLKQMLASINVEKAKTYSLPPQKERNYPSSPIPEILVSKTSESPNNEVSQIPPEKKATGPQKGITALSPKSNRETSSPLRDFYEETSEELPEKIHIRNSNEIMNALNEESSDEGDMQSFIDFSKVNGKKRDELEETDQNSSGNYGISDDIPSKFKTEENVLLRGSWEGKDVNNFSKSRYEIAAELVKTEESYVSSLKVIIEVFSF